MHTIIIALLIALVASANADQAPSVGGPVPGLTASDRAMFDAGKKVFSRVFTVADGLGPLFNNSSCAACHEDPVVGGAGAFNQDDVDVERHASADDQPTCDELTAAGGPVFREQAAGVPVPPIPGEARVRIGLRSTPALFSSGSIDDVPEQVILDNQRNGGRAAKLPNGRIGRFGRKATDPDLPGFVRGAFATEQGIDVPSELSEIDLLLATFFVSHLAPPPHQVRNRQGQRLFNEIGCATCHIPSLPTVSGQRAFLYSDLLLHDMGPGLADLCKGVAKTSEFRTEPLMGLRFRSRFMHDGRALRLSSAIASHGGEGQEAADKFFRLKQEERQALVTFLSGL
jgi:CxxC motif-containing protein (DUF1111 family)